MAKKRNTERLIFPREDNDSANLNGFHVILADNVLIFRYRNWEQEIARLAVVSIGGDVSYKQLWSNEYADPNAKLPIVLEGKYLFVGRYDAYVLETGEKVFDRKDFGDIELDFSLGHQFVQDDVYYVRIDGRQPDKGAVALNLLTKQLRRLDCAVWRPSGSSKHVGLALHVKEGLVQGIQSLTGRILWLYEAGDLLKPVDRNREHYFWPYTVHGDRVYLLCSEHIVVLEIATGKKIAQFHYFEMPEYREFRGWRERPNPAKPYPYQRAVKLAVSDQVIAILSERTYETLMGIDPVSGEFLWMHDFRDSFSFDQVIAYKDMVYVSGGHMAKGGCHIGLDARTGKVVWQGEFHSLAKEICVNDDYVVYWSNLGDIITYSRHVPSPPPRPRKPHP